MENFNQRIIVGGFALLLFGILLAVTNADGLAYLFGGLGLFLSLLGCFAPKDQKDRSSDKTE